MKTKKTSYIRHFLISILVLSVLFSQGQSGFVSTGATAVGGVLKYRILLEYYLVKPLKVPPVMCFQGIKFQPDVQIPPHATIILQ
ncbi:MAG: hypothetical protein SGI87_13895 [Flavobacteriales bacterium]|nr:hypothetical protein [Flavobacteriales bacterium]